jgi:hypothetical protein
MSNLKFINPPAFPRSGFFSSMDSNEALKHDNQPQDGMTMMDYFAASALQGILAREQFTVDGSRQQEIANQAYEIAFEMVEVRKGWV